MAEETLSIKLDTGDAEQEATKGVDAISRLVAAIEKFGQTEASDKAVEVVKRLTGAAEKARAAADKAAAAAEAAGQKQGAVAAEAANRAEQAIAKTRASSDKAAAAAERASQRQAAAAEKAAKAAEKAAASGAEEDVAAASRAAAAAEKAAARKERAASRAAAAAEKAAAREATAAETVAKATEKAAKAKEKADKRAAETAERAAKAEAKAAEAADKAAEKAAKAKEKADKRAADAADKAVSALGKKKRKGDDNDSFFGDSLGAEMAAMGPAAAAAIAAASAIGAILAKLLRAGAELAISAVTFREESEAGLEAVLKSATAARAAYGQGIEIAVKLGLNKEDTIARVKSLVTAGFRDDDLKLIITAVADVRVAKGDEAANALQKTLEKVKAKNKFDQEAVNALAEAGIQSELVLKALSKKLGLSIEQVQGKLKAGQISVAEGIKAILAAAGEQTGGAAEKAAKSLPKLLESAKTLFESLFDKVDLGPVKEVLDTVKRLLSGPEGEALKKAATNLFNTLFKTLSAPFQGKEGSERLTRFIVGLTAAMEQSAKIMERSGPQIIQIIDGLSKIFDSGGSTTGGSWLLSILHGIDELAKPIDGYLLGMLGTLTDLLGIDLSGFVSKVSNMGSSLLSGLVDFGSMGRTLGANLVQGLIAGIAGGAPGVAGALIAAVAGAVAGASGPKGADAHSPSRKTGKIGGWMGEGLVVNMLAWRNKASSAAADLASGATAAMGKTANDNGALSAVQPSGAGAGAGVVFNITVNVGKSGMTQEEARATGEEIGDAAHRRWMNRFLGSELRRVGT